MIVYLGSSESKTTSSFLTRNTTVLDKLRNDFNSSKKDRCVPSFLNQSASSQRYARVSVVQKNELQEQEGWNDCLMKMTSGVLSTLSSVVSQYDDNMKRLEAQRMVPGW